MTCYFSWRPLVLWVLYLQQSMFYISFGCLLEERIALMDIRSSLMTAHSKVPVSWGQGDNCCSWEMVTCNSSTQRISRLDLSSIYLRQAPSSNEAGCNWNLNLTIFSSFHELQLLDLSLNFACLHNLDEAPYGKKIYINSSGLVGLAKLQYLNLSDNSLMGCIPASLWTLVYLQVINMDRNNITGALHNADFRNLKDLRELHMRSNHLNGRLPASLFSLPRLEYLDLADNLLQGDIPVSSSSNLSKSLQILKLSRNNLSSKFSFFWLRNCPKLEEINLSGNANLVVEVNFPRWVPSFQLSYLLLSGCNIDKSIIAQPSFLHSQHHLQVLDLSSNNLSGSMPNWLFTKESTLVYLNLGNNSLTGSLYPIWYHQSNLGMINISMNHVAGQLPTNISSVFPALKILDVSHNVISGDIPPSLCKLSRMLFMDLSNNNFTGEVPACLFTDCVTLRILKFSNNNLGGLIVGGASNLSSSLFEVYLDGNKFEGELPQNLSGNLEIMDLHDNKLSGELDSSFWNLSGLHALSLASNNLTGQIHPSICGLTKIELLDISNNNLSGSIPHCSSSLPLILLNMSGNSFSGDVLPYSFFNSSYVTALDIRQNQFTGNIDWLQYLDSISLLFLAGNKFEGQIPPNLCHLQNLNIIDLSRNRLSGSLPPCVGSIPFGGHAYDLNFWFSVYGGDSFETISADTDSEDSSFTYNSRYDLQGFTFATKGNIYTYGRHFLNLMSGIDLSMNMLSGEIPWEVGNLSHIKSLNLSYNLFTGQIPTTFSDMTEIESMDLSHNELSGSIPWQLAQLSSLEVFSVANNNLSGCVPNLNQFGSFGIASYEGNSNLHMVSLRNVCSSSSGPVASEDRRRSYDPILYAIIITSFALTFWATIVFSFCHSFGGRVILEM